MKFDSTPLYEKIKKYLRDYIMQTAEKGNEVRIESERQMAESMRVSRSSINRAISELVVEGYLVKRRGKGVFILPKEKLEQKVGAPANRIALILPDISDYYYGVLANEVERIAYNKGYDVMLCIIGSDHLKEQAYLEDLENKGLAGIIAAPYVNKEHHADIYRKLYHAGTPVVLVNRVFEDMSDLPHVIYDQGEGSDAAVRHFWQNGRRNILFVGDFRASYICQLRRRGCVKALEALSGPALHELYVEEEDFRQKLLETINRERINGMVCYNDIIAITALNVANQAGLKVPQDIGIIGYDNSFMVNLAPVPISSVDFPHQRMAEAAWQLMETMIRGEEAELAQKIPTSLVLRESSAAGSPAKQ